MKKKRRICFLAASAAVLAGAAGWIAWGNTALVQTEQVVRSERLPAAFSGYRIAHVSDLHNAQFGTDNEKLLELLRTAAPDCIAVTGDIVDSRRTDFDVAAAFMDAAAEIAPVYYVTGNHESRLKDYPELEQRFTDSGVTVLHGAAVDIVRDGGRIRLIGIDDPDFSSTEDSTAYVADALEGLADEAVFTVLLSHRPELFAAYAAAGVDLTLRPCPRRPVPPAIYRRPGCTGSGVVSPIYQRLVYKWPLSNGGQPRSRQQPVSLSGE